MRRTIRAMSGVACAVIAAGLASCVVERPPSPGVPVPKLSGGKVPDSPVATRAQAPVTNASIRLNMETLGTVVYDGQALPLVSPDGRWLAVQSGDPPDWATILAEDGAQPANRSTITVFDASAGPLKATSGATLLPPGLMLGRAADAFGFLVEAPQRDGQRWIGKVSWASGRLDWLVKDKNVNAHATLTSDGTLLYTTRKVGEAARSLCMLSSAGTDTRTAPDASYAYPLVGDDPTIVFVPLQNKQGTDLEAIRLSNEGKLAPVKFGASIYRRALGASGDVLLAHQMAITSPGALPSRGAANHASVVAPLVCLSPRHAWMGAFNTELGAFDPLVPRSVAAVSSPDPTQPGYFCALQDSLVFVPLSWKLGVPPANILSEPFVPRAVLGPDPAIVLFGPVRGSPDKLEVLKLHLSDAVSR